ncbi:MAG: ABC transporter permease [Vicinamibacteria bacterium]
MSPKVPLTRRIALRFPVLFSMGEAVGLGLQGIRAYKLRAGLTILGVVMGIMTVTGMSSIVAGLNASMASQIQSLGASVIFIRPFAPGENVNDEMWRKRKGLTRPEVEAIAERPAVGGVAAIEPLSADLIKYGNEKAQNAQIAGVSAGYDVVHDIYVTRGRFISQQDVNRAARVVVIGADIADSLFPFIDPIDKEISIDGRRFTVIGVIQRLGKFLFFNRDTIVLVPLGSVQKRDPRFNFLVADMKPASPAQMDAAIEQTRETLRRMRKLKYLEKDNFAIFGQDTFTQLYQQITGGIYLVMIAISSIGLLVGGVGVMNIMLVSVTERTREIGVRKALGAKRRDIMAQFLTEAVTLTGAGGVLGILIGSGAAWLINTFSPFPAVIQTSWVALAFAVAVVVGLVFGLWPAFKAARLDPIEALRYE